MSVRAPVHVCKYHIIKDLYNLQMSTSILSVTFFGQLVNFDRPSSWLGLLKDTNCSEFQYLSVVNRHFQLSVTRQIGVAT